jgi:hypothetical protein
VYTDLDAFTRRLVRLLPGPGGQADDIAVVALRRAEIKDGEFDL